MPDPGKKLANSLVAMSSAAILAVYAAGYTRTRAAARRLEAQSEARIPAYVGQNGILQPIGNRPADARHSIEVARPASGAAAPAPSPSPKSTHARPSAPAPAKAPDATQGGLSNQSAAPATIDLPEPPAPIAGPSNAEAVLHTPAPVEAPPPAAPKWKDGTYYGWGSSRHGDIQAAVIVEAGRIASATIAQCLTRYSCNVISRLPPEVPERQSPNVDYVSGATQSANAFYYAVVDALSKAK